MDQTAQDLAMATAGAAQDDQYFYDDGWQTQSYPLQRPVRAGAGASARRITRPERC
jgi:hypothetical protein